MSTVTIDLDNLTTEEQETVRQLSEKKKEPRQALKKEAEEAMTRTILTRMFRRAEE